MKAAYFFATISGGSALASWQVQLEWGVRILAGLVAIAAGLTSIYLARRGKRVV
jgi:hypothetical protein